jgi:hypothetical protein
MKIPQLAVVVLALAQLTLQRAMAQAPPFSYRGVYETTLPSGTKIVFFVSQDNQGQFGTINTSSQVVSESQSAFTIAASGLVSFGDSVGAAVSATFTATNVSGTYAGQSFNAPRTVLNSVNGSLQGGYTGYLWFQADGSLNPVEFVLTPAGNFYALANTAMGIQGGLGTWSENGTFSGVGVPGGFSISGSGIVSPDNGVFTGSYTAAGTQLVVFYATKENVTYRLRNISTRGLVGTGSGQMIAGFIISNGAKRVMIRAIGPSLTGLGVAGALANPTMELHSATALIASNDDWQVGNDVAAIQATGLAPSDPHESALLVTLEEGPYTVIVSGVGGSTGVALVEVYEID